MLSGMGELHLEVIVDRMRREFRVEANVGRPQVAYRETVTRETSTEGPLRAPDRGARAVRRLRAGDRSRVRRAKGSCSRTAPWAARSRRSTSPAIRRGVEQALTAGAVAGYPVVDLRVAVVDGSYHPVDSSEIAFQTAGSIGTRAALARAGSVLLEPVT